MNVLDQRLSLESEIYRSRKNAIACGCLAYVASFGGAILVGYGVHVESTQMVLPGLVSMGLGAYGAYATALHTGEARGCQSDANMFNVTEAFVPLRDSAQPPVAMTLAV